MATDSAIVFQELTGKKRTLKLQGAGLPFAGADWASMTTLVTTWNPGNPQATQHILGSQELPSNWDGEWNTTRLVASPCEFTDENGVTSNITLAFTLRSVFESLQRDGQSLRVTWSSTITGKDRAARSVKLVRVGRIEEFNSQIDRQDDIRWNASFAWIGRGEQQQQTIDFNADNLLVLSRSLIVALGNLNAAILVAKLRRANKRQPETATAFTLGQLETLANAPLTTVDSFARFANSTTNRLAQIGNIVNTVRALPVSIANRLADVASNTVAVTNQFLDEISRQPAEVATFRTKVSNVTRNASYLSGAQTQAQLVAAASDRAARAAAQRLANMQPSNQSDRGEVRNNDIITIHLPRAGETMLSISRNFYDGEDFSGELSRANNLPAYTIVPPRIALVIPNRSVLEGLSLNNI